MNTLKFETQEELQQFYDKKTKEIIDLKKTQETLYATGCYDVNGKPLSKIRITLEMPNETY